MEKWAKFEETDKKQYFVSTEGRIKSVDKATGKVFFRKPSTLKSGYRMVKVQENQYYLHRLVAEHFIPNVKNKPTVNHKNLNKSDNRVENLEYATQKEQIDHAWETGAKTAGNISAIALDSNGFTIAEHDTLTEAFASYDGTNIHYSNDIQIIGNVIVMKRAHCDELSEDERFAICSDCFERTIEYAYVVDGQYIDSSTKTAKIVNHGQPQISKLTKSRLSVDINGHTVSRLKNMIGVGG